jgi:uncharacterized protein (DUF1697 family)
VPGFVAFVRAINVAGHARVAPTDLQRAFESAGCHGVTTHLQTGNVVFVSPVRGARAITTRVCEQLADLIPEGPQLAVRSADALAATMNAAPFSRLTEDRLLKLYVTFLMRPPRVVPGFPVVDEKERLQLVGMHRHDVFVVSRRKPNGFYGFPNQLVEEAFGVAATSRNWSTVTRLLGVLGALTSPRPRARPAPVRAAGPRPGGRARR